LLTKNPPEPSPLWAFKKDKSLFLEFALLWKNENRLLLSLLLSLHRHGAFGGALCGAGILAMVIAGRFRVSGRLAHKVVRLVRALTRCETHNIHLKRKLEMLSHKSWREQVLKELGGMRKLKLWEAAKAGIEDRRANPPRQERLSVSEQIPGWLLTPFLSPRR